MKDLPLFPCADGMASLVLSEIPYKREAYILVRSVYGSLDGLLRDCAAFCRSAGAEQVYAGGEQDFSAYPVYAHLVERSLEKEKLPEGSFLGRKLVFSVIVDYFTISCGKKHFIRTFIVHNTYDYIRIQIIAFDKAGG